MFYKFAKGGSPTGKQGLHLLTQREGERSPLFESSSMLKRANSVKLDLDTKENYYLDNWAVSGYERFGLNENSDGFERAELEKSYGTFVGAWVCLDHDNDCEAKSVGGVIDAILTPEDYVRNVLAVSRTRGEKKHPGLEQKIISGEITDTSMGCYAAYSVCTVCANVATNEMQYCGHLRNNRGATLCNHETRWKPIRVGELNRNVSFFEDTIITSSEGADRNAKLIAKLASLARTGPRSFDAKQVVTLLQKFSATVPPTVKPHLARLYKELETLLDEGYSG